jgi:peroxiredoxin
MRTAVTLLLAALLSGCAAAPAPDRAAGQAAPDFSVTTLNGATLTLAGLKGKVVLVNFWATWCPPCREEIPDFVAFYNENKDRGLEIVGLSVDDMPAAELKPFVTHFKMSYPVAFATSKIVRDFDPGDAIPTTIVIDKRGIIRDKQVGMMDRATLDKLFQKLSAEK